MGIMETIWLNIGEGVDTFTSDKIWQASIDHGYIPAEYMLVMFVDSIRITP